MDKNKAKKRIAELNTLTAYYAKKYYEFVREIVTKYKDDERIIIWDVFNEPGASNRKSMSLPHLKTFFISQIFHRADPHTPETRSSSRYTK